MRRFRPIAILAIISLTSYFPLSTVNAAFKPPQVKEPTFYDADLIDQYRALSSEGYNALDDGDLDRAVAKFTEQTELIPEGKYGLRP